MVEAIAAPNPLRILIVDDEATIRITLAACLKAEGHEIIAHGNAADALVEASLQPFDLIFLDVRLGTDSGLDYIQPFLRFNPWAKVVVITAFASVETAVEAMKRGAADYLQKPFSAVEVQLVTQAVAERRRLELKIDSLLNAIGNDPDADYTTNSTAMGLAISLARQVAASNAPVLLQGEVGTGKARLAHAVHAWSKRSAGPYAIVYCQGRSADELEAELFGAASELGIDAPPDSPGRVSYCDGGTLVLDEVAALPASLQPKLLRLVVERQYERRDDFRVRNSNVRIVATTSANLDDAVRHHRFRTDLLLALDVVRVQLPPLRERIPDIAPLAKRYLAHTARANSYPVVGINGDVLHALERYQWPGNLRELRNMIERAVILCQSGLLGLEHFPPNFLNSSPSYSVGDLIPLSLIHDTHIQAVVAATGSVSRAATILGLNYSTLWRRLRRQRDDHATPAVRLPPITGNRAPLNSEPEPQNGDESHAPDEQPAS